MIPSARMPIGLTDDSGDDSNSRAGRRPAVTSQEYADAINFHAKQTTAHSLYPGHVLEDLALFLRDGTPTARLPSKNIMFQESRSMAILYTLDKTHGRRCQNFVDPDECSRSLEADVGRPRSHILFLKGYPSPHWLTAIGSRYLTDPEYFNFHLRFRCRRDYFSYPSLPSATDNMIRLRFITIGSREAKHGESNQDTVDRLRRDGAKAMQLYEHDLMVGTELKQGDSIVRDYAVLDEKHFIIEQEITVCLNQLEKDWTILVCTDAGNDLSEGPQGPWLPPEDRNSLAPWTIFYPTIQHRPQISLRSKSVDYSDGNKPVNKFPQSATLLAEDYGKLLDPQTMMIDPFYAMTDFFRFCAFSEVQFLNLMEAKIESDTGHGSLMNEKPTLSNLLHYQEIVDAHLSLLQANVKVIKHRGGRHWPHASEHNVHQYEKAKAAADTLLEDFENLVKRSESLLRRCSRGMDVIMNNAMLAESKRAISQAQGVAKLNFLAFFYVPLSFTTSFFGMNFVELGTGNHSLWIWFVTSVPLFLISLSFLLFSGRDIAAIQKKISQRTRN